MADIIAGQPIGLLLALTQAKNQYFVYASDTLDFAADGQAFGNFLIFQEQTSLDDASGYSVVFNGMPTASELAASFDLSSSGAMYFAPLDDGVVVDEVSHIAVSSVPISENATALEATGVIASGPSRKGIPVGLLLTLTRPDATISRVGTPSGLLLSLTQATPINFQVLTSEQAPIIVENSGSIAVLPSTTSEASTLDEIGSGSSSLQELLPDTFVVDDGDPVPLVVGTNTAVEQSSLTETSTPAKAFAKAIAEAASLSDTIFYLLSLSSARAETMSATSVAGSILNVALAVADAAQASEASSALATMLGRAIETAGLTSAADVILPGFASLLELVTALESETSSSNFSFDLSETLTTVDTFDFQNAISMDAGDYLSSDSSVSTTAALAELFPEEAQTVETFVSILNAVSSQQESATASERLLSGVLSMLVHVVEGVIAKDASLGSDAVHLVAGDLVSATDIHNGITTINRSVAESGLVADGFTLSQIIFPTLTEVATASDLVLSSAIQFISLAEALQALDATFLYEILPSFVFGAIELCAALSGFLLDTPQKLPVPPGYQPFFPPKEPMTFFVANTNMLTLKCLQSAADGSFIPDANITVTVVDSTGVSVSGSIWPLPMYAVSGTPGDYQGVIPAGISLVAGKRYKAIVNVSAGPNRTAHFEYAFVPLTRQ